MGQCARAVLLACAFDLPARVIVLDMKQFNGKYACVYCEDEGETPPGDHLHRFWPHNAADSRKRTHKSLLQNATEATLQHDTVCVSSMACESVCLVWYGMCVCVWMAEPYHITPNLLLTTRVGGPIVV